MRNAVSRRRLKRMIERAHWVTKIPDDYKLDVHNAACVEGGCWDTPQGVWPADDEPTRIH
jgi:hypothetical protein